MSINALIEELKQNEQDFEFYPTTKEMIAPIYKRAENCGEWLDIGCGTCNFRKHFNEFKEVAQAEYNRKYSIYENSNYNSELRPSENEKGKTISKYFIIEKSKILLDRLEKDVICLGTDFLGTLLIDKPIENIFCNPPYSQYELWTTKIIYEANSINIFLVIPERWKDNEAIKKALEESKSQAEVIGSFDFLNAERAARAKVDIVHITRTYHGRYESLREFNDNAFDRWFDDTYKMRDKKIKSEYEEEQIKEKIVKNKLVAAGTSKAKILVDLYNEELETLNQHFLAISSLDVDILETIGIKKSAVKEALKKQVTGLKARYWKLAFEELEEITSRLTYDTRQDMYRRFKELQTVEFSVENIYPFIIWVLKNASTYYNDQLIAFFKKLTSPENVKPYKSNQKAFEEENWGGNRYFKNKDKMSHYALDYRIIMSSPFSVSYHGRLDNRRNGETLLQDIFTIARNLGFNIGLCDEPTDFGEKYTALYEKSDKKFMEFRVYKNGNMHIKFDIEFTKAMNVEVSRLLGWIRKPEDIKKEFPQELAQGAEKYFKISYDCLTMNTMPLLTVQEKPQFEHLSNEEELTILLSSPYQECLKTVLNNIDNFSNTDKIEENDLLPKCLEILQTQKGFVYKNCLITKHEAQTKIEFREKTDFQKFSDLLNRKAAA